LSLPFCSSASGLPGLTPKAELEASTALEEGALPDLFAESEEEEEEEEEAAEAEPLEADILESGPLLDEPTLGSATPGSKIRSESDLAAKA